MQKHGKLYVAGKIQFFKTVLAVSVFIIIDALTYDMLLASLTSSVVMLVGFFAIEMPYGIRLLGQGFLKFDPKRDIKIAVKIAKATFLFASVLFLTNAIINIPRYFIDLWHIDLQGYFGIIILPAATVALLVGFVINPLLVRLSELYKQQALQKFTTLVHKIILLSIIGGLVLTIATYFLAAPILSPIFGVDLTSYQWQITAYVFGGVFYAISIIYLSVLTVMRKIKEQVLVLLAVLAVILIGGGLIISQFAIDGAVWLYVATCVAETVVLFALYNSLIGSKLSKSKV
jgi:O-antigen/teichoic acid export membrane protein